MSDNGSGGWGSSAKRSAWAVADQAVSSITNFALALVVARTVSVREFGAFGLVFASYTLALGIARAISTEPLALRHSTSSGPESRRATGMAVGAALTVALAGSVLSGIAGVAMGSATGRGFIVLAALLPFLLVQDAVRLSLFVNLRERAAFINDAVWAVALAVTLGILFAVRSSPSVPELLIAWGAAAGVAAAVGLAQTGALPAVASGPSWWRENRDVAPSYVGEFLATTAGAQFAVYPVGIAAGLVAAGALRGGQVLMGPLNIMFMGAALVAVPEAVRLLNKSPADLRKGCAALSLVLAGTAAIWGFLLTWLPDSIGESLLQDTWAPARSTVVPLALWLCASGPVAGASLGTRVLGRARQNFRTRLGLTVVTLGLVTAGALWDGARGAAWGLALTTAAGAVVWWVQFHRALEGHDAPAQAAVE
ncbi:MAG: hypothetical protein M3280_08515 [Actinomycetota bacterium]|nr:hypothetical protein [Actinomycetota bacterium]